jgi:CheY-like chemotaxis protein
VSDTGIGMPRQVIERAFDPFFTTKPMGQGAGLGLSMIYGFTRQSEGYCKIESEVGKGTAVILYLPRHHGEAAEQAPSAAMPVKAKETEGEVVLVVEDEQLVRTLVVEVLSDLGYQALEAGDGQSGLAILQSPQRIDLLVTDIGLPGLNGRQMVDAARKTRQDLKILFMTGYSQDAANASGFLEPGMAMMTKPFGMGAMANRIRTMIQTV